MSAERDLARLLATLAPGSTRHLGLRHAAAPLPPGLDPLVTFREDEAITCIPRRDEARRVGLPDNPAFRRIVLTVHSSLGPASPALAP